MTWTAAEQIEWRRQTEERREAIKQWLAERAERRENVKRFTAELPTGFGDLTERFGEAVQRPAVAGSSDE